MRHFFSPLLFAALLTSSSMQASAPVMGFQAWENDLKKRLEAKDQEEYRNFSESAPEHVKNFYRANHTFQTLDFVLQKHAQYLPLRRQQMDLWEAIEMFNTIVDESDPDIDLPQCYHLYQTAEALRKDGHPKWLILTGFIHDLGKILALYGEPQWAVVGDTFPVGCAYADQVVFPEYFSDNTDMWIPEFQTPYGIYSPQCGFKNLIMSWGHDEYLYQVVKDYLPAEAGYTIRFHSFYAAHRHGGYDYLMDNYDREMLPWLNLFSKYDLYSKSSEKLDIESLKPYYSELIKEFFPDPIGW